MEMNREKIAAFIHAIEQNDEDAIVETGRILALNKVQEKMGYGDESTLTEVGNVQIKNNDVFVSGKKVGSVNIDSEESVVEFTNVEGKSQSFDDTESLHRYLNGLNESDKRQSRLKSAISKLPDNRGERLSKAADKIVVKSSDGDGEEGDYKKHDPRGSKHKDPRMENPKGHDHGHDDKSGLTPSTKSTSSGGNPPDKTHDLKNKHKDGRMENPKKHDHGHDDPKATGTGKNK